MKLLTVESRQTYAEAAQSIRDELRKYTTFSIFEIVLKTLHEPKRRGMYKWWLPWLLCQILEIAFELSPSKYAKAATQSAINRIVQKLFDLQDLAFKSDHKDQLINFRKIIVHQSRFDQPLERHAIFMDRFYSILFMQDGQQSFNKTFQNETGLSLEKFALLSSYVLNKVIDNDTVFVAYGDFVSELCAGFDVADVAKFIRLLGGTIGELQQLVKDVRKQGRELHASEYFEEPVLISKPIIIFEDGISTPHPNILAIGISEFVMRLLKEKMPGFKDKFTKLFERYVEELFADNGIEYIHERNIQSWYKAPNEAPASDFLIRSNNDTLFIDVKGVEPKQTVLTSSNGRLIKERLKDAHVKAIAQISECARKLEELSVISNDVENRFGLIITHQEYYILDASTFLSYIGDSGETISKKLSGCINPENLLFCTVSDWEKCLAVCVDANLSIIDFMKFCVTRQKSVQTRRFTFEMHVDDFAQTHGIGNRLYNNWTSEYKVRKEAALSNVIKHTKTLWKRNANVAVPKGAFWAVCNELKHLCGVD